MNFLSVKNYKNKLGPSGISRILSIFEGLRAFGIIFIVILGVTLFEPSATYAGWLNSSVSEAFLSFNQVLIALFGKLLAWSVGIFTSVILIKDFADVAVVKTTWTIVRDFVNMFFILILVVIAFGTIFNSQKYSVTSPGLLGKFIVAALLINFSLVIGLLIINISQIFSNVFLTSMGDFAGNLGAGLNLHKIFTTGDSIQQLQSVTTASVVVGTVIDSFFVIIVIVILFFSMLAAAIFSLVRIPILWALLIVSPVVWALDILPFSQGLAQKWWKLFISWTFFLPSYLFMLLIGTVILRARTSGEFAFLFVSAEKNSLTEFAGFALQDIFFYVLILIILVGGLKASLSIGAFTSTGVSGAFNWGKQRVENLTYVGAFKRVGKKKAEEIKEKGLPGPLKLLYGGERAEKLKEARVAQTFFREKGAIKAEKIKQFREDVQNYRDRLGALNDSELLSLTNKGAKAQRIAARELLRDKGKLGADELADTFKILGRVLGEEFLKSVDFNKLSKEERQSLYNTVGTESAEIARKIATSMAEKGDWRNLSSDEATKALKRYSSLFTLEGDKKDFLNKAKKYNFEESVRATVELKLTPKDFEQALEDELKKMSMDKIISDLSDVVLKKLLDEGSTTRRMIMGKLNKNSLSTIAGKINSVQEDMLRSLIVEKKVEIIKEEAEQQEMISRPITSRLDKIAKLLERGR